MPHIQQVAFIKNHKKLFGVISILVIAFILSLTVFTAQQQQNTNSKAINVKRVASISEKKLFAAPSLLAMNNRVVTIRRAPVFSTTSVKGKYAGKQNNGVAGVIINGPIRVFDSWWWHVDFDSGPDGWTSEDFLRKISGDNPSPEPIPTGVPYSLQAPLIVNLDPANNSKVNRSSVVVKGGVVDSVSPASQIKMTINNEPVNLTADGAFQKVLQLPNRQNAFNFRTYGADKNPRQQTNVLTAYLDGSVIYGSDAQRAAALRTFSAGKLKTTAGNLPPLNTEGLPNTNDAHIFPNDQMFLAGDTRSNENIELTATHTLFIREHNLLADAIARQYPALTDEEIYQSARQIVAAELQVITYKEFIPALLGSNVLPPYNGYKPNVNAGIANEFSTAAFRIGHTLVNDDVEFFDNEGEEVREELELAEAFFNPHVLRETGPDPILKYLATDNAQEVDTKIVRGLRDFLFGPAGAGGLDLASLNIQRGRDHGLSDYNTTRKAYGLPPITNFNQITSNIELQQKLRDVYGNVNNIDLWVGGLAEDHVSGTSVGQTFQKIMADQFIRLRDGDRFWYQRNFSGKQLAALESTRLSDVIRRNTTITKLQDNVFFFDEDTTLPSLVAKAGSIPDGLIGNGNRPNKNAFVPFDAYGNNKTYPYWGQAGVALVRMAPASYADGIATPAGPSRPSPRLISNMVASQSAEEMGEDAPRNNRQISDWIYAWGQFIDHDFGLTSGSSEAFPIQVPKGDPLFDPEKTGGQIIPLRRSMYDVGTGTGTTKYRDMNYMLRVSHLSIGKIIKLKGLHKLYANPSIQGQELYRHNVSAEGTILAGPIAAEGQNWWRIYSQGKSGWIPESALDDNP